MTSRRCFLCAEKGPTTLHMFPKDPSSLSLWKQIYDLQEFDDVSRLFLCSNHFKLDDYREPSAQKLGGKLTLKPGAFPSVSVPNKIRGLSGKWYPFVPCGALMSRVAAGQVVTRSVVFQLSVC
ncbi:hypothetical protein FQA39_LY12174 [Lamprigera yunnana]|nr:hypothetical protein FQA39_LY12174 [Lamprigera yunnana]